MADIGRPATDFGVRSALSNRLTGAARFTGDPDSDGDGGSLNSYGTVTDAFDDQAQEMA